MCISIYTYVCVIISEKKHMACFKGFVGRRGKEKI